MRLLPLMSAFNLLQRSAINTQADTRKAATASLWNFRLTVIAMLRAWDGWVDVVLPVRQAGGPVLLDDVLGLV